jgi:S1-C subfamily serine protease
MPRAGIAVLLAVFCLVPQAKAFLPDRDISGDVDALKKLQGLVQQISPSDSNDDQRKEIQSALDAAKAIPNSHRFHAHFSNTILALVKLLQDLNANAPADEFHQTLGKVQKELRTCINLASGSTAPDAPKPVAPLVPVTATSSSGATPSVPDRAPTVALTADQARAVVLISGDTGVGTGFLVKMKDGPVVITNQHVIANNPNLKITTSTGVTIPPLSYSGATDRDLAMIAIKDAGFSYLPLAPDVTTVSPGDEVITPGNSQGGAVMLNTDGKVLGIGPDRIEVDNPVYHGNSGGPIFHVKTGAVIGVVTEGVKVDNTDELDKASFASRNSAIRGTIRYFGMRVDNVPQWETFDLRAYQGETAFLDRFDQRSHCLLSFLNLRMNDGSSDDDAADLWQRDGALMKANSGFKHRTSGDADAGQKLDALRELYSNVVEAGKADVDTIQNSNNFYAYDRERAKEELADRQVILKYLDSIGDNVDSLGHLPRSNNN